MAFKGYYLKLGDSMAPGDYMCSQNGAFWLGLITWPAGDGLEVPCFYTTYQGSQDGIWGVAGAPVAPSAQVNVEFFGNGGLSLIVDNNVVWGSGFTGGAICILGNDGNLGIYSNSSPSNPGKNLWNAGSSQGEGQLLSMTDVVYDLPHAVTIPRGSLTLDSQLYQNLTDETLTAQGSLSGTETQTSNWFIGGSISTSVQTEVEAKIPFVGGGKVTVGATISFNWQYGQQYTESISQSAGFSEPVPPNTCMEFSLLEQQVQVMVPFSATISMYFPQSGTELDNLNASGYYAGGQGTNFQVTSQTVMCEPALGSGLVAEKANGRRHPRRRLVEHRANSGARPREALRQGRDAGHAGQAARDDREGQGARSRGRRHVEH